MGEVVPSWIDEEWIGLNHLSVNSVMDYFKLSPFYVAGCDNDILYQARADMSKLVEMQGIQFELDLSPDLAPSYSTGYVIKKVKRMSPTSAILLGAYFVVGADLDKDVSIDRHEVIRHGTVFALPDLNSVMKFNLNSALCFLHESLASLEKIALVSSTREVPTISSSSSSLSSSSSTTTSGHGGKMSDTGMMTEEMKSTNNNTINNTDNTTRPPTSLERYIGAPTPAMPVPRASPDTEEAFADAMVGFFSSVP